MVRQIPLRGPLVLSVALLWAGLGCSQNTLSSSTRISRASWRADLDEWREVMLSCDLVQDRTDTGPVRTYEQLRLAVRPRKHLHFESTLKTVELGPGVPRGQLRYRNVEARTDETHRKVWFVQRDTGRIIATFDREKGETTGPDDKPPAWATPDGGELLDSPAKP